MDLPVTQTSAAVGVTPAGTFVSGLNGETLASLPIAEEDDDEVDTWDA